MRGPSEWLSDIWDTKGCSLFTVGRCSLKGGRYQCYSIGENRDLKKVSPKQSCSLIGGVP